jgi:hypothetical protein
VDVARRLYLLTLVTAAAVCAYVVYRVYWRGQEWDERREQWPEGGLETSPATATATMPGPAPAEAESMVGHSMERSSASVAARYDENGSPLVAAAEPVAHDGRPYEEPAEVRKPRLSGTTLAALGALAGAAAIALGAWAVVESTGSDEDSEAAGTVQSQELISVLSQPATERIPLQGSQGRIILVAAANGKAYLVLDGLGLAPSGRSYQAWVIRPGADAPASAAVFEGSELVVPLALAVRPGAVVAITIERAGGVPAPTSTPRIVGERT